MAELDAILQVLRLARAGLKLFEGCEADAPVGDRQAAHRAYMARTDLIRSLIRDEYIDHTHVLTERGRAFLETCGG